MHKPFIIIIDGPMGAGKTTVAKILHLKLDQTALLIWDEMKWLVNGLENTPEDKNLITEIRFDIAKRFLSSGINVIVEGGFSKKERLDLYLKLAKEQNLNLLGYYFSAPEEILLERALDRPKPDTEKEKISKENILENIKNYPNKEESFETIETNSVEVGDIIREIIYDVEMRIVEKHEIYI